MLNDHVFTLIDIIKLLKIHLLRFHVLPRSSEYFEVLGRTLEYFCVF